jgi:cytochrome c5
MAGKAGTMTMLRAGRMTTGFLLLCSAAAFAAQPQSAPPAAPKPFANGVRATGSSDGERKFQQNCSRCHNAPDQISPRIAGTLVMHMRVRASLSEADARAILRYLNP